MIDVETPNEPRPISSWESEPESPWVIEEDATGQKWRVSPTGQRLKVGNTVNVEAGRPKKEVRADALKLSEAYLKRAKKVLTDPSRADDDPTVLKYGESALRYGLGTSDEVELVGKEQQAANLAASLAKFADTIPYEVAQAILSEFKEASGIK